MDAMDRENITLTGTQETMLATLYGRALDSRSRNSVLNDTAAGDAVERIDYDFGKTGVKATNAVGNCHPRKSPRRVDHILSRRTPLGDRAASGLWLGHSSSAPPPIGFGALV